MKSCHIITDGTVQEIDCNLRPGMYVLYVYNSNGSSSVKLIAK